MSFVLNKYTADALIDFPLNGVKLATQWLYEKGCNNGEV